MSAMVDSESDDRPAIVDVIARSVKKKARQLDLDGLTGNVNARHRWVSICRYLPGLSHPVTTGGTVPSDYTVEELPGGAV